MENWFNQQLEERKYKDCFDMDALTKVVNQAIEQLPEKCREIFSLSRKEGLSYRQIAERLGISVKTVETQISIALKRIREILSSSAFAFCGCLFDKYLFLNIEYQMNQFLACLSLAVLVTACAECGSSSGVKAAFTVLLKTVILLSNIL